MGPCEGAPNERTQRSLWSCHRSNHQITKLAYPNGPHNFTEIMLAQDQKRRNRTHSEGKRILQPDSCDPSSLPSRSSSRLAAEIRTRLSHDTSSQVPVFALSSPQRHRLPTGSEKVPGAMVDEDVLPSNQCPECTRQSEADNRGCGSKKTY